jgi:hypothetical protein
MSKIITAIQPDTKEPVFDVSIHGEYEPGTVMIDVYPTSWNDEGFLETDTLMGTIVHVTIPSHGYDDETWIDTLRSHEASKLPEHVQAAYSNAVKMAKRAYRLSNA